MTGAAKGTEQFSSTQGKLGEILEKEEETEVKISTSSTARAPLELPHAKNGTVVHILKKSTLCHFTFIHAI